MRKTVPYKHMVSIGLVKGITIIVIIIIIIIGAVSGAKRTKKGRGGLRARR